MNSTFVSAVDIFYQGIKEPPNKTELGDCRISAFRRTNRDCEPDYESDIHLGADKYLCILCTRILKFK